MTNDTSKPESPAGAHPIEAGFSAMGRNDASSSESGRTDAVSTGTVDAATDRTQLFFINSPVNPAQPVLIFSTAPDQMLAKRIAHMLVEEGLAACVNLGAESLSMYMWQGVLEGENEVALTIKTTAARAQQVADRLGQLHPYDVPELLVLALQGGSKAYLKWLGDQTQS